MSPEKFNLSCISELETAFFPDMFSWSNNHGTQSEQLPAETCGVIFGNVRK